MEESAGSADREMGVVMETLDYKANKLKETWTGFAQSQLTQENLGNIIEFLNKASEGLTGILNGLTKISKVGGLASGLGGQLGVLGGAWLNSMGIGAIQYDSDAKKYRRGFDFRSYDYRAGKKYFNGADRATRKQLVENSTELQNYLKNPNTNNTWEDYEKHLASVGKTAGVTGKALKSLGASILNIGTSMAVGMAIDFGISMLVKWIQSAENARKASKELTDEWKGKDSSLQSSVDKYTELNEKIQDSNLSVTDYTKTKKELSSLQDELINKYGQEKYNLDLVNGSYEDNLRLIKQIRQEEAVKYLGKNNNNIQKTRDFLNTPLPYELSKVRPADETGEEDKYGDVLKRYGFTANDFTNAFQIIGTRKEIQKNVNNAYDAVLRQFGSEDKKAKIILAELSNILNDKTLNFDALSDNEATMDAYGLAVIQADENKYDLYTKYQEAADDLNDAYKDGNADAVAIAADNFENLQKQVEGVKKEAPDTASNFDKITDSINETNKATFDLQEKMKNGITFAVNGEDKKSFDEVANQLFGLKDEDLLKLIDNYKNGNWDFDPNNNATFNQQEAFKSLINGFELSADNASALIDKLTQIKILVKEVGSSTDQEKLVDYLSAQANHSSAMKSLIDSGQNMRGNVDLANRPTIYWNNQNLTKYRENLLSIGYSTEDLNNFKGTTSTILGSSGEFGKNRIPLAYTPIIDDGTGQGKVLNQKNLEEYLNKIADEATNDSGKVDFDKILKLDADGFEVDGQKIKGIIASIGNASENVAENMHDSQETYDDIAKSFDAISAAAEQAGLTVSMWIEKIKKEKFGDIFSLKDAKGQETVLGNLSANLDQIQTAYSTITETIKEYNSEGYITVDSLQSILSLGDQYLQYLFDENGNLVADTESLKQLTLARINEMEIKALNNISDSLNQIKSEEDAQTYLASALNDTAMAYANLTEAAIAAKLAQADLTDETQTSVINNVLAQQERVKSLFDKVRAGINKNYSGAMATGKGSSGSSPEDTAEKMQDALDNYNKKVKDINKSLSDLDKEEHLSELKYTIEQIAVDLDRFKNTLDSLDSKLDLTFENDFPEKLNIVNEQLSTATQYGSEMRAEMERLMSIQPQTGDEAEELASQLESLSQEFFDNQKNIIKYRNELYNTTIAAVAASGDSMVNQIKNARSILDNTINLSEHGSLIATGYWSMPLTPSVSKDKVQQQRDENNKLIAEEQRYQDEIAKIRKRANEMQKAEKDQERAEKRADYAQQLEDAKKDYNKSVKSATKKSSGSGGGGISLGSKSSKTSSKNSDDISANVNSGKSSQSSDATTEILNTVKSSDFINSLSGALSDSFKKAFEQSGTAVHDAIMALLLQNSVWDELPDELTSKLLDVLGVAKTTWDSWIAQPENALQAVSLARDNNIGSWDLLRDDVKHFLEDTGIIGATAWNEFISNNPLQAFALAIASWDSMRDLVQQYMNDTTQIVQNGADAIANIQINAPGITEDSWNNLQTLIANKIQEVLNAINDTFGDAAVDLNFNVNLNSGPAPTLSGNEQSNPQGIGGSGVVAAARNGIGVPYVWGGQSESGWDCSGFVINRFATQGINIGARTTQEQWANDQGQRITDQSQLQPGDCLYFANSSGDVHHVAIYAGNGMMIHAANSSTGTIEQSFSDSSYYQKEFIGAKRYYSAGTLNASAGQSLVGDEYLTKGTSSPTPELILSPTSRRAYLAGTHGAEMLNLHSGDVVVPYNETKKLLADGTLNSLGNMGAFAKGTKGFASKLTSLFGKKKSQNDKSSSNNGNSNSSSSNNATGNNGNGLTAANNVLQTWNLEQYHAGREKTIYMYTPDGRVGTKSPAPVSEPLRSFLIKLREGSTVDSNGILTYNGAYHGAVTSTFGTMGDVLRITQDDGSTFYFIIADEKSQVAFDNGTFSDHNPANWLGHNGGQNILEFDVDWAVGTNNGRDKNGKFWNVAEVIPALNHNIVKIENMGKMEGFDFSGVTAFNSATSLFAKRLKEVYDRIQSLMGTFKTDTHTSSLKVAPYKSLGTTRGSYGFDVPFTKRESGGWTPANTIVQTNENGQEATIDKNGHIVPIGNGNPQVIVSDHNFPVINAKDYAAIKKYGGVKTPVKFLAKGNTFQATPQQLKEAREELESLNLDVPILPQTVDDVAKMKAGEEVGGLLGVIKEHIGSEVLTAHLQTQYSEEQLRELKSVSELMGESEQITSENLPQLLEYAHDNYEVLKSITDESIDEIFKQYDTAYEMSYAEQHKNEIKFQEEFRKKFDKYAENATEQNWWSKYSKIAQVASDYYVNTASTQAWMLVDRAKNKISTLQEKYQEAVEQAEKAPTAGIAASWLEKAQGLLENQKEINDEYISAMEAWTEVQLKTSTERDNKFLSAISYLDADIQDLQNSLEDAVDAAELVQKYSDINSKIATEINIQEQRKAKAHEAVQVFYNSEDENTRWLLDNIKFDELFDANNEFNNFYSEQIKILTSYGNTELTERFKQIAAIIQQEKKTWSDADETIKELTKTLNANKAAIKNQKVDTYVSLLERKSQILDYVYEKQQLLIDAESATNEILQNLRDQRRDYTAELRANKDLGQWLDADTRALLFNEDDYSEMMSEMDRVQTEVLRNQQWYRREISKLDENDLYHQELLTEQYTKRNEQLQEELETAQQRLDVAKKTAEYYNIAKERDTQIIMGNRMVNVANPESLYNAAMEKSKAETLLSDTLKSNSENQVVRDKQIENDKIKDQSNGYQAMVSAINEMSDAERKAFADFLPPIEQMEATLKAMWKTDLNWIVGKGLALDRSSSDLVWENKGTGYDSSYDYQGAKGLIEKMDLPDKTKEHLIRMLDEKHGLKDANFANNKYTSDTTYDENILPENTPVRYADSVHDKKKKAVEYKYDTDYSLILQEIEDDIAQHQGVYTLDYDPELVETIRNRKLVMRGEADKQTDTYGGLIFKDEQDNYDVALEKYEKMLDAINDKDRYQSEFEKEMLAEWVNNRGIAKNKERGETKDYEGKDYGNFSGDLLQSSIDAYNYSTRAIGENTEATQKLTQNLEVLANKIATPSAYYKESDNPNVASVGDLDKTKGRYTGYRTVGKLAIGNINAYASGTQSAKAGLANVDEDGFEYKLRKVNGDKYVPLNEGDMIFPFKATENLWNIANNPQNWLEGQLRGLGLMNNTSNISSVANNINNKNTSYQINGDIVVNEASNVSDIIQGMTDIIATQDQNRGNMQF